MKYKVIRALEIGENIVSAVLKNRKIKDVMDYLHTGEEHDLGYCELENIEWAQETIEKALLQNKKIGLVVDCDVDGYTSSAIWYQYLKGISEDIDITLFFHTGKQHGLSDDVMPLIRESDVEVLFVLDAGSNDFKQHEELSEMGIQVIVFDHHETDEESSDAIIVNNQLSDRYVNKQLSGAGVTYRVCQAVDDWIGTIHSDDYLDLVALGNIADGMNMMNLDTRYLVQKGLANINNTLMKCIIQKQSFSMQNKVNITTIGWNVAPMLNAVIRVGTQEDKEMLFKGFISDDEEFCMEVVNMCLRVQRQQNANVKKVVPKIEALVEELNLHQNKVIMINATGIIDHNITGLVANKLLSIYKRPIILLQEKKGDEEILTGSVRAPREVGGFKNLCVSLDKFIYCEGHQNAFGCSVHIGDIETITESLNKKLTSLKVDDKPTHSVDAVIQYGALKVNDIMEIGNLADLWGNGVSEPLFVVKGIKMNTRDIRLAGKNNTIMFSKGDFSFVKFFTNRTQWEEMCTITEDDFDMEKNVVIDVICKFKINEWMGRVKPQLEIIDFASQEDDLDFF